MEKKKDTKDWIASAENLLEIYRASDSCCKDTDLILPYTYMLIGYKTLNEIKEIPIQDKILRLMRHFLRYPKTSTSPPFSKKIKLNQR